MAPKVIGAPSATGVTQTGAVLHATVNPEGQEVTGWRFAYGTASCVVKPNPCKFTAKGKVPSGTSPVAVVKEVSGLEPGTVYHFLLEVENADGKATSLERIFATRSASFTGLPDKRAYEQASPVDKDGGDASGAVGLTKASADGDGITFGSTFGLPGGQGAQALPSYLALRAGGSWSTQGLLPPPSYGERAQVQGWLPDFSRTYSNAARLGSPRTKAMIEQSTAGASPTIISPYTPNAEYAYVGANADASIVFFESDAQLETKEGSGTVITGAAQDHPNVYAWNRATGELSLAGALNSGEAPPRGTLAGPYNFSRGINANTLRTGGSKYSYYVQGTRAITEAGDIYFTEVGTGQLYLRLNPTAPQSTMEGEKCLKPADACTIHVSASKRATPDPAGPQPAAFAAASADGSVAFFTSPEKLTAESNTGPEQPEAAIGKGSSAGAKGTVEDPELVPKRHAVGVAVAGAHLYWADPASGAIGRAGLDGSDPVDLIAPEAGECELETDPLGKPGVIEPVEVPSTPRYVAVDASEEYVYWTNSGVLENGAPLDGEGTIGRAKLGPAGEVVEVDPDFICGEVEPSPGTREAAVSNPQGIAVNATHIYWANAARSGTKRSIARANIDGSGVEAKFLTFNGGNRPPYGVALSASHVYFAAENPGQENSYVERATLGGTELSEIFIGKVVVRGVATDGTHLYWAAQKEEAIGRMPLADFPAAGSCSAIPTCEKEFVEFTNKPIGALNGLAISGTSLYWSVNGEAPINPGNDLYRFEPSGEALEDLTYAPAPGDPNGAEVQGVLGASADGARVYFAANADLDGSGPAAKGNCKTPTPHGSIAQTEGSCEVYLWEEGTITEVGRVRGTDATDWTGTPYSLFAAFRPKSAFLTSDGGTLLFRSAEKLSAYPNEGTPELYRFRVGDPALACVSCPPAGEAADKGPGLGSVDFPGPTFPLRAMVAMVESRNLSADGDRAFFETAEALVPADTNGQGGCPGVGSQLTPACLDAYEWEAPGTGSCSVGAAAYSPITEGCTYLISSGKDSHPSYFADASESGGDVFFFTRQGLVGQDKDELQDAYDARVGGGIAAQNPASQVPCGSVESCHGPYPATPAEGSTASAGFNGPPNPAPKHKKKKQHKKKHKAKKHRKHKAKKHKRQHRANANRRAGR